ncbi:restriction endonuclease subunit S [Staphylococcus aureus]|uniref:restriction endonuclease subunit S n=1 Tax=Staphylococcus aureus TaxID=1280 RepID=UPI0039A62A0A
MSNTQKKNVPELRFPGFEGEWEEKTISSFLKESKIKGSNGSHAKKLTVKLWGKGVVPKKETFKGSDNTQYYKRKAGQLMYGKLDFLNCAFGIVPDSLNNYESTIDSPSFDFINGDSKFLLERIKLKSFYKKFGDIANGSRKAKRINQDTFLSLPVFAPKYDEQLRIGEFFSKLVRQIELEEQKLELLQQQKKGYMQKIFSQELRFKDENGEDYPDWEEKQLGEIFQIISGSTPLKSNKEFYEKGNINWVKTTDLNNSKVTHSREKITEYAMNSLKLKLVPKNSVLIAMYGGFNQIGRTGLLKIDATINQAISALLMNHETNPEFIQAYLNYQVKGWKRYAASSRKDPNITKKDIEQFKVPYVSINEQQKIGGFFSKLDQQIELEEQKLELLQQQKKGLLKSMFI